ncbi:MULTISPECIES: hypothetical protein [Streptomyces violaceusniger group]|uniref:Integral membrane protein n=2 Tax=Streptomyces javensis TaxID=114698 RepID=A0ABS0RER2_9ACTN|nr:hypothetical protein [Streptomyces javensis]MBI0315810.1 hypothetical protein [Streptomyces javensis]
MLLMLIGLIILAAAAVIGVVGVLSNLGGGHALTGGFSVFGFDGGGYTGTVFLSGIVIGAAALLGLGLMMAAVRRRHAARRGLTRHHREAAPVGRDRGEVAGRHEPADDESVRGTRRHGRPHLFGHRTAHR